MADAATRFVGSLTAEQRQHATFPFDSSEREHWGFVPTEIFARNGLILGAMSEAQRKLADDLLRTGLSQRGYLTASSIMELESILRVIEESARQVAPQGRGNANIMVRDPVKYYFSVFGTPAAKGTWGWRVEGHHVSLNFTIVNGSLVASAPSFFGSNPAEVKDGPKKGLRILAAQEDTARALVMALDGTQRAKAIIDKAAPNDIATMNTVKVDPLAAAGIVASELRPAQRELLMKIVETYVSAMASDVAEDRMVRLRKGGLDTIAFAWAGELQRGARHYYRVQGPTFLIEYDNTQNNANHIHSVWRDFQGDFGRDLLREHLKTFAH
ncbi:MAG: hypothetical protein A3H97_02195 [Acidobacteria bacterium RIFCSPLOWO2_02_FULL_65_29]|nr:MAG: hypothetical protein A3H97_02195 [Acidobacteria bacterium RIFCSPLOWO2_02_FULL_65_29]